MSESVKKAEGGLTRREMLKKSALVGVVAWTVPIVGSFNAPAFGQVTVSPASCTAWDCGDPPDQCGTTGPLGGCFCDQDVDGATFCWENIACSDPSVTSCSSNADCAPGQRCTTNCCGQTCLFECGTNPSSDTQSQAEQLTAVGMM